MSENSVFFDKKIPDTLQQKLDDFLQTLSKENISNITADDAFSDAFEKFIEDSIQPFIEKVNNRLNQLGIDTIKN